MTPSEMALQFAQKHSKGMLHCKSCGKMHSKSHVHFKKYFHKKKESKAHEAKESKSFERKEDKKDVEHDKHYKKPKLGSGKRFAQLKGKLAAKGAKDPGALAAYIGRKKYGKKRFQKLAAKGKHSKALTFANWAKQEMKEDYHHKRRVNKNIASVA